MEIKDIEELQWKEAKVTNLDILGIWHTSRGTEFECAVEEC